MLYRKNISIRFKIIFDIMISTAIISGLFLIYDYHQKKDQLTQELVSKADRKIKRLANNLIVPLWEIDSTWVDEIAMTEMLDKDVCSILIEGDGALLVAKTRDKKDAIKDVQSLHGVDAFITKYEQVIRDGEKIGYIYLHVSDKYLNEVLWKNLLTQIFAFGVLVILLSLLIYLVLDRLIISPLKSILDVVYFTSENDYTHKVMIQNNDEVGELAKGLNSMIDSVMEKEEMLITQSRHAAMGEMISMIAHQWRQPITVIAMSANNLQLNSLLSKLDTESCDAIAAKILEQTEHLSKTIDDFRNFFSPNKKKELAIVNDIIEENFQVVGKSLENHNIIVEKKYESTTPVLLFSRELLQVIINIVNNAKEAIMDAKIADPKINVRTYEDVDNIYISICNKGLNIPEDIKVKIFDPYFSTKDQKNGTGLGLHMSKTIIEKHLKGRIKVKNIEDGVCFNISIPKKAADNE